MCKGSFSTKGKAAGALTLYLPGSGRCLQLRKTEGNNLQGILNFRVVSMTIALQFPRKVIAWGPVVPH